MKRLIAVVAVALVTVSMVCAQITVGGRLGFHGNVGSQVEVEDAETAGGFTILAYGRYNFDFHKPFGIQTALNFTFDNGITMTRSGDSMRLAYNALDLPILATYDLELWRFTFTFKLGPHFHFPLGKLQYQKSAQIGWKTEEEQSLDANFSLGIVGGLSTAYNFNEQHAIVFDLQYLYDFIPLKVDGNKFFTRGDIALTLGYQYKFNFK